MSALDETMSPTNSDSPNALASKISFDESPLGPPRLQAAESKSSRMNFLKRKVKSRDEDDENVDEMEIKKLEKKVEYLKKKRQLMLRIKKMERGIETGEIDSDDDTTLNKGSPKRWSLKPRKWKKRSDSFDDELTYDDEDSPFLQKFHNTLDCIEDGCSPVINEIVDLDVMCHERASRSNDESVYTHDLEDETSDTAEEATVPAGNTEQDGLSKSPQKDPKTMGLAAPISMLAKSISQNVSDAHGFTGDSPKLDKHQSSEAKCRKKFDFNTVPENDETMTDAQTIEGEVNADSSEYNMGWMDKAASVIRSHSFAHTNDDDDVGLDCFDKRTSQPKLECYVEQSEMDAKFAKVTVTAMALSGLSITSKKGKNEILPPVHVVLSVLDNDESSPLVHIPSLRVVKDPSRVAGKKKSTKSHVMCIWGATEEDSDSKHDNGHSSVSFTRLVGLSMIEGRGDDTRSGKSTVVKMSPSVIHLRVCIRREGSEELLPIGVAKILVSGGPREKQLAIPLKPEYYKSMEELIKKLNTKPPQTKWESFKTFVMEDEDEVMSCIRFKGYKNEVYRLEKDACIRINVQVTPETHNQGQVHSQMTSLLPWAAAAAASDSAGKNDDNHTSVKASTPDTIGSETLRLKSEASDKRADECDESHAVVGGQRNYDSHVNEVLEEEEETGFEVPPLNTNIIGLNESVTDDASTIKKSIDSTKSGQSKGWFNKGKEVIVSTTSNEPVRSEPSESPSPSRSEKTSDTETSQESFTSCSDDELSPEKNETLTGIESLEIGSKTTSKNWSLKKSTLPKKLQRARALSSHRTTSGSLSGSSVPSVTTTTVLGAAMTGVGLSNQIIHDSDASFEVLRYVNGDLNPVIAEKEESTAPFICNADEMIETDVTMNVAQSANCIQGEFSVDFAEDSNTKTLEGVICKGNDSHLIENIGVVNDTEGDDHYDLSECNCEECTNKRNETSNDEGQCQGIELELKTGPRRSDDGPRDMMKLKKSLMNMSNLTSKLARSKSRKAE